MKSSILFLPFVLCISSLIAMGKSANQEQILRIGSISDITAMDPHYSFMDLNLQVHAMVYGRLFTSGPNKELRNSLALSSTMSSSDPNIWNFKLKAGIHFHNGQSFSKNDVLCTIDRIRKYAPHSPSGYAAQLESIDLEKSKVINSKNSDPLDLALITKKPFSMLNSNFTSIFIMSCDDTQKVMELDANDIASTGKTLSSVVLDAFASGQTVNGTGPYIFKEWKKFSRDPITSQVELVANQKYEDPDFARWGMIQFVGEPDENKRVSRFFTGDFSLIANVPNARLSELRNQGASVVTSPSQRMVHMQLYQRNDGREKDAFHIPLTDKDGNKFPTPFENVNIRRAFAKAIDKNRLVAVMGGQALPTEQFMLKGRIGYIDNLPTSQFDIEEARNLIALASEDSTLSFFKNRELVLTIHGPNDRYPNDEKILNEIAKMWTETFQDFSKNGVHYSIKVRAQAEPKATYFARIKKYNVALLGGGIDNGHAEGALRLYLLPGSGLNYCNYSNDSVKMAYDVGVAESSLTKRDSILSAALKEATIDQAVIPLYNQIGVWAVKPNLSFTPRIDELTMADTIFLK